MLLYAKSGVGLCRWTGEVNKSDGQGLLVLLCCMLHGLNSQFHSSLKNVQKSIFAAERGVEFSASVPKKISLKVSVQSFRGH